MMQPDPAARPPGPPASLLGADLGTNGVQIDEIPSSRPHCKSFVSSKKAKVATEVVVVWEYNDHDWQLIFKDNGKYFFTPNNDNLLISQRLVMLQAKIHSQEVDLSGRTIILVPNFFK